MILFVKLNKQTREDILNFSFVPIMKCLLKVLTMVTVICFENGTLRLNRIDKKLE